MIMYTQVVIHHSVTPPGTGARLTDYHLVLDFHQGNVKIYEHILPPGRSTRAVGGANSISYSVCLVGDFRSKSPPSELFQALIQALAVKIRGPYVPNNIVGHRDVGKSLGYITECPGSALYKMLPTLRARVASYL